MILPHLHTTLATLLHDRGQIPRDEVEVRVAVPDRAWVDTLLRPTLCCYLFELAENTEFRNATPQTTRANGVATIRQQPRRVDLRYFVCAFAGGDADEQALIWRAMAVLLRHTTLPAELMPAELRALDATVPTKLGTYPEAPRPLDLWGALELAPRPALLLTLTAPLDLLVEVEAPLVLSRTLRHVRPLPEDERRAGGIDPARVTERADVTQGFEPLNGVDPRDHFVRDGTLVARERTVYRVAGRVCARGGAPIAAATVSVVGQAAFAVTDAEGRFRLDGLRPGPVTLRLARKGEREGREVEVVVPWPFDLVLLDVTAT